MWRGKEILSETDFIADQAYKRMNGLSWTPETKA